MMFKLFYYLFKELLPNEEIDEDVVKEKNELNYMITKKIQEIDPTQDEDELEDVSASLNETINKLEENMISDVVNIQNILVDTLLISENRYSPIQFTVKQKQLSSLLLFKNDKLEDSIYSTISYKVLNTFESTSSNLIEKMKYSIVSELLSSEKYIKIYNNMEFNRLVNLDLDDNTEIMALSVDGTFLQLIKIKDLNLPFSELKDNTEMIKIDNLKFLLNSPLSIKTTQNIERLEDEINLKNNNPKEISEETKTSTVAPTTYPTPIKRDVSKLVLSPNQNESK